MLFQRMKSALWSVFAGLATLLYLVEEWLWDALAQAMQLFGRLPVLRQLEAWIRRLPPAGAAFFFVLPTSLALPVKLIALHQIAHGHLLTGALVIIAAKVTATALFARIYVLTLPALLQVAWFVRLRNFFLRWRDWAYAQLAAHPWWCAAHDAVARWRAARQLKRRQYAERTRRWRAWQRLLRMRRVR